MEKIADFVLYNKDYVPKIFGTPSYKLIYQYTGEEIGYYKIPNAVWLYLEDSFIYLSNLSPLKMAQNTSHRKLFKSQTLRQYTFELTNNELKVIYSGEMIPNVRVNHVDEKQVFEGSIQSTRATDLLPIFAGIHIIEEDFRRIEQNLG